MREQKTFLLGSSLIATNAYKNISENFHLLLNIVSNLNGLDQEVGSRPQIKAEKLHFHQQQIDLVTYLCLIVTPVSFLLLGWYCYRKMLKG